MAAEIQNFSACGILRVMEFRSKAGERVRRVMRRRSRPTKILAAQAGACMTVPHTLQVRCCKLE